MIKKPIFIVFSIILAVLVTIGFVVWHHYEKNNTIGNDSNKKIVKQVGISKSAPNNNSPSGNTPEPAKNPSGTGLQQSKSSDTNGTSTSNTSRNEWVTSVSGNITLEQPVVGTTISSGTEIVGTAKTTTTIDYRLSDNSVGVLTQGSLNVVNGKFSGVLYFTPKSNKGQLDVFTTNNRGVEFNEIQVGVNF